MRALSAIQFGTLAAADPCYFVGLRLSKSVSECKENVCSGLFVNHEESMIENADNRSRKSFKLRCEDAGLLEGLILESLPPLGPPVPVSMGWIMELIRTFGTWINPELARVLYSEQPASSWVIAAMRRTDLMLLELVREREFWIEHKRKFLESKEISHFWKLANLFLQESRDMDRGSAFSHFILDVASVTGGMDNLDKRGDFFVYPPKHRRLYKYEFRRPGIPRFVPEDANEVVATAAAIDRTGSGEMTYPDLMKFFSIVDGLRPSPDERFAATDAIFRFQLRTKICPKLLTMFDNKNACNRSLYKIRRRGLILIKFCRSTIPTTELIAASLLLAGGHPPPLPYGANDEELVATDLLKPESDWRGSLDSTLIRDKPGFVKQVLLIFIADNRPVIRKEGYDELKSAVYFETREAFEKVTIAFGRLFGLCIRYSVSIAPYITFFPATFESIREHADVNRVASELALTVEERFAKETIADAVQRVVFEPIFYIRLGLKDVLGPAGPSVFTDSQWRNLLMFKL